MRLSDISKCVNKGWDRSDIRKWFGPIVSYDIPDREQAYINGVTSGYSGESFGDSELNDKFGSEFSDGLLCGMSLSQEEFYTHIQAIKDRYKKIYTSENNAASYMRYGNKKSKWDDDFWRY